MVSQITGSFLVMMASITSVVSETFKGTLSTLNLVIENKLNSELFQLQPLKFSSDFCPPAVNAFSLLLCKLLKQKGNSGYAEGFCAWSSHVHKLNLNFSFTSA